MLSQCMSTVMSMPAVYKRAASLPADQELSRCLQTASSHLRKLPEDMPGAHSSCTALLTAVLGSMHALQKATMAIQTTADPHLMMAAVEGTLSYLS